MGMLKCPLQRAWRNADKRNLEPAYSTKYYETCDIWQSLEEENNKNKFGGARMHVCILDG